MYDNNFVLKSTDGSHHIGGQSYTICFQTREGFCGITYQSEDFSISGNATDEGIRTFFKNIHNFTIVLEEPQSGDETCSSDFVGIFVQDKTGQVGDDRYCGTAMNHTTSKNIVRH